MTTDAVSHIRVLAAGAERIAPNPTMRVLAAGAEKAVQGGTEARAAEGPKRANVFVRKIAPLLALVASYGCDTSGPENTDSDHDADVVQDVDEEADAPQEDSVSPDVEDRVEADVENDGDVGETEAPEEDGDGGLEAEDSGPTEDGETCPSTETVEEHPAAGTIAGIAQNITEITDVTTECDGSTSRMLAEHENVFASPVSRSLLAQAVADGTDTVIFGRAARFTMLRVGLFEFGFHVEGAAGTRRPSESVNDGVNAATVQVVTDGNVNLRVTDMGGTEVGIADLSAGQYYILPSGRVVMVTNIRYDAFDPLNSTCDLAILEAPIRGVHGGALGYGPGTYAVSMENDVLTVFGIGLVRTSP